MTQIKLGSLTLQTDLILAPMMDVGTPSFRHLIIEEGGVGMIFTPMLFINQLVVAPKTILPHLDDIGHQRPAAVQIVASGKNKEFLERAIDILNSYEFDVLDINSGCPSRRTMNSGGGAALLKQMVDNRMNPDTMSMMDTPALVSIIEIVQKYSDKPVSLKTRLGFENEDEILKIMPTINDLGIEFLTIHGRTVKQKYSGHVNLEIIRKIKEIATMPVVGNGDVKNYADYMRMKDETKCDAVMIGRAAKNDPSVFNKINACIEGIQTDPERIRALFDGPLGLDKVRDLLSRNREYIESTLSPFWNNPRFLLAETRRMAIWFIKGIPGYKKVRERISKFKDFNGLWDYIFSEKIELDFAEGRGKVRE